jgi:dTDP-4-amino-4,6-dideoxygalactose transaminase
VIDNASGLGGPRPSKSFGQNVFEVFSMHATKPFAIGEGGVIFGHRLHDAALRSALNFALNSYAEPGGPAWGFNGKMSEFHAAIGIVQLSRIRDIVTRRQAFAAIYRDRLAHFPGVSCPQDIESAPWQIFPTLLPSRADAERFIETAAEAGIEIRRSYRPSLSCWPDTRCYETCPVTEDLADRMCVLPVRNLNSDPDGTQIANLVMNALDRVMTGH